MGMRVSMTASYHLGVSNWNTTQWQQKKVLATFCFTNPRVGAQHRLRRMNLQRLLKCGGSPRTETVTNTSKVSGLKVVLTE